MKIDTTKVSATNTAFTIPTFGTGYNYTVDCDDAGPMPAVSGQTGNYTCNYSTPGEYTVAITGVFPQIYFNGISGAAQANAQQLISIEQWGTQVWRSMQAAFYGASNMNIAQSAGIPNLSSVTDMSYMFERAATFNQDISLWDTSNVMNMSRLFRSAIAFNQDISGWDTSNVTNMGSMFAGARAFNQDISAWDTSKVTSMSFMFYRSSFNQDISGWNISQLKEAEYMFPEQQNGMSVANYDKLLIGWSQQTVQPGVAFGGARFYCDGATARAVLSVAPKSWRITHDRQACPPTNLRLSNTSVDENMTTVGNVLADNSSAYNLAYTLVSGSGDEDNGRFALDRTTGALSFLVAPDYENPTDAGGVSGNNTYSIRVRAAIDLTDGPATEQTMVIMVQDVEDTPPTIVIVAPEKLSKQPITSTEIHIKDNAGIRADTIAVDTNSTANTTDFVCAQTSATQIDCTVTIASSGNLVIRATDVAGNSVTATEDGYVIDTESPTVTVDNQESITRANARAYTVSGTCVTGDGQVKVSIQGLTVSAECIDGIWRATFDLSGIPDGNVTISASRVDAVGNVAVSEITVIKDTRESDSTAGLSYTGISFWLMLVVALVTIGGAVTILAVRRQSQEG